MCNNIKAVMDAVNDGFPYVAELEGGHRIVLTGSTIQDGKLVGIYAKEDGITKLTMGRLLRQQEDGTLKTIVRHPGRPCVRAYKAGKEWLLQTCGTDFAGDGWKTEATYKWAHLHEFTSDKHMVYCDSAILKDIAAYTAKGYLFVYR